MSSAVWLVGLHLLTGHADPGLETVTPGIYVRSPDGWTAGMLRNSFSRTGLYAGRTFESGPWALTLGGITGYKTLITPLVVPSVKIGPCRFSALFKHPSDLSIGAVHLSLEKEF